MKKSFLIASLIALNFSVVAAETGGFKAGDTPPPKHEQDAGYKGTEDTRENTVNRIRDLRDGAWVTLEGNIIKQHQQERYAFRDKTETIDIVVPQSAWKGKEFGAEDLVRISGRVHGQGKSTIINVEQISEP
ncbi:NirD/YgiW/YdeI family stress tolerance protein [Erwiniaceae bacterium BAC15a-03b]|uniref:NirD/YgiW/YdeI family stress tolerance protein n=1 Tax=Winslowiella arboricola TaxID=2978220 RepID=A0A9J6PUF2_9GAMM|nr:NirD/YgiW/YdeI family stress tolerance protein [Winslowiella arboricola]MCU5775301.1 NirD/YgiW/YdeI family stress tolerance protein [Winslowiella arboricola]MCU5780302.1 NirD/YgiW/YdeI family stress tolerance protein [Winslowiella arboricola]